MSTTSAHAVFTEFRVLKGEKAKFKYFLYTTEVATRLAVPDDKRQQQPEDAGNIREYTRQLIYKDLIIKS